MSEVICPTCATKIDTKARCESTRGIGQCMAQQGHPGWHWTDMGHGELFIWTGLYGRRSCPQRLGENDRWCIKDPNHEGAHNDGKGTLFTPEVKAEEPIPT